MRLTTTDIMPAPKAQAPVFHVIPTNKARMTRVLSDWIEQQMADKVPAIDIQVALDNAIKHLEILNGNSIKR